MAATKYVVETFTSVAATTAADKHYWRIRRSGRVLAISEGYGRKHDRDRVARELAKQMRCPVAEARLAVVKTKAVPPSAPAPEAAPAPLDDRRPPAIPGAGLPGTKDVG